jgi:CheY-like chemotaxis protein
LERRRPRPRTPPVRPLVLIVDGHEDTREPYALALESWDFETITEPDGASAYARAWLTHPDIIIITITEITLPGIDDWTNNGWKLVRDLKGHPRTRGIPIVVLTAHDQPAVRVRAEREDCATVLVKPCLPEQLASALRALLASNVSAHISAS